ncbi:MAG: hypothetical protein WBB19_10880 [Desulforhopalus sp.]
MTTLTQYETVYETKRPIQPGRRVCTYHKDKNGRLIYSGDRVRYGDFTGVVVFRNAAFRVDVTRWQTGDYLQYNSSLLWIDGKGTRVWEVIEEG